MKFVSPLIAAVLILLGVATAAAGEQVLEFSQPEYKQRYHTLTDKLRCLVCQNQSVAESDADLAQDLRQKVHEMLEAGKTNEQIVDYMVARYGDFVLYEPPVKNTTLVLWFAPFLIVGIGAVTLIVYIIRRKPAHTSPDEISESVRRRVRELLDEKEQKRDDKS